MATAESIPLLVWTQFWQVSLLLVVVGVLGKFLWRRRPQLILVLWALVFVKCLTPPLWQSPTGIFNWLPPPQVQLSAPSPSFPTLAPASQDLDPSSAAPPARSSEVPVEPSPSVAAADTVAPGVLSVAAATSPANWHGFLGVLWLFGVSVLLIHAFREWRMIYWELASAEPAPGELQQQLDRLRDRLRMRRPLRLRVTSGHTGPFVFGHFRPTIVIPRVLLDRCSNEQLELILAHEIIHARRGDTALGAIQFLAQLVWWFHPCIWWAARQANRTCERCCDGEVIDGLGCPPARYARCLLDILELKQTLRPGYAVPGMRAADVTTTRVKQIMTTSYETEKTIPLWYWILALALSLLVLPGGLFFLQSRADTLQQPVGTNIESRLARPANSGAREAARAAVISKDWPAAITAYRELTEQDGASGGDWFMLGYCLHANGQLEEAIPMHRKASEFPRVRPTALYNLACAYALQGRHDESLAILHDSIEAGFVASQSIKKDSDFASLLDSEEFQELAERARPRSHRPVYRQFDFWVGPWDVYNLEGNKMGTTVVSRDEKGFLLTEKWTDLAGDTGTSISFYNPGESAWKQTWIDAAGTIINYSGKYTDEQMQLEGDCILSSGQRIRSRLTMTPQGDGTIHRLVERSADVDRGDGDRGDVDRGDVDRRDVDRRDVAHWEVYFEGKYVPSVLQ